MLDIKCRRRCRAPPAGLGTGEAAGVSDGGGGGEALSEVLCGTLHNGTENNEEISVSPSSEDSVIL